MTHKLKGSVKNEVSKLMEHYLWIQSKHFVCIKDTKIFWYQIKVLLKHYKKTWMKIPIMRMKITINLILMQMRFYHFFFSFLIDKNVMIYIWMFQSTEENEVNLNQIQEECLESFGTQDFIMEPGIILQLKRFIETRLPLNRINMNCNCIH